MQATALPKLSALQGVDLRTEGGGPCGGVSGGGHHYGVSMSDGGGAGRCAPAAADPQGAELGSSCAGGGSEGVLTVAAGSVYGSHTDEAEGCREGAALQETLFVDTGVYTRNR